MNKPFFTFIDRVVPVQFFEDDPVKLTLIISDQTDQKIVDCSQAFLAADKETPENRFAKYAEALDSFIGAENAEKILSRAEQRDCFTVFEVYSYLIGAYKDAKTKKLTGSAR